MFLKSRVLIVLVAMASLHAWAQPEMKPIEPLIFSNFPGLVYTVEEAGGDTVLYQAITTYGYWSSKEIVRAPYLDIMYSAKGGALMAAGESADSCYVYFLDLQQGDLKPLFGKAVPNPWLGKKELGWVRTETISSSIFLLYNDPEADHVTLYSYAYNLRELKESQVSKTHFGADLSDSLRLRIAPDGKHIAYATTPKPLEGVPGFYESTLKVLHFSNMTVTDATKSIQTAADSPENAWPAFEFNSSTYVHYVNMSPQEGASNSRVKIEYKAVEVEQSTNTEFFSTVLPRPSVLGDLTQNASSYTMAYVHGDPNQTRYFADHDQTRSLMPYPHQDACRMATVDGQTYVMHNLVKLLRVDNPSFTLGESLLSHYNQIAFQLNSNSGDATENQVWFYDPRGMLYAVTSRSGAVNLIGVLEHRDPLGKKL